MEFSYSVQELAALIPGARVEGEASLRLTGLAALADAGPADLSFLANLKYRADLQVSRAGAVLVPDSLSAGPKGGQAFLRVADPSMALADICAVIEAKMRPHPPPGIHPAAVVAGGAAVDPTASIGPQCVVGEGAQIGAGAILESQVYVGRAAKVGEGCHLHPRSMVHDYCVLRRNVRLQAGAVIGSDGFGYLQVGRPPSLFHKKVPQVGIVVVEDDVEIGANTTIDRARFGETRIGQGTKIDNLVQVGHNVKIGRHCIVCAQVGISGSTVIGDYVVLWGQAGLAGHLSIGDGAFIGGQAGVSKDVPPGGKVTGTPARPLLEVRRQEAALIRLPDLLRSLQHATAPAGDTEAAAE